MPLTHGSRQPQGHRQREKKSRGSERSRICPFPSSPLCWGEAVACLQLCTPPEAGTGPCCSSVHRKGRLMQAQGTGDQVMGGCRRVAVRMWWHGAGWYSYAWLVLCRLLHVLPFSPRVYMYLLCTCLPWLELEQECCHCDSSPIGMALCIHSAVSVSHIYKACGMHLGCGWIFPEQAAAPAVLPRQGGAAGESRGTCSGVCRPSTLQLERVVL